jgi:hypothetical protein
MSLHGKVYVALSGDDYRPKALLCAPGKRGMDRVVGSIELNDLDSLGGWRGDDLNLDAEEIVMRIAAAAAEILNKELPKLAEVVRLADVKKQERESRK